ncbi:hypothetical protein VNO80_05179 [Phaseolus coccineus]|uniref:Uncharacterized protein n=1 Tax=Phaseolus coccineus TaxID=3886 RepID=A0AAN9NJN1_PHACN
MSYEDKESLFLNSGSIVLDSNFYVLCEEKVVVEAAKDVSNVISYSQLLNCDKQLQVRAKNENGRIPYNNTISHSKSNQIKTVYMNKSQLAGSTNQIYPHSIRKKKAIK